MVSVQGMGELVSQKSHVFLSILGMADSIPAGDDNTKEPAWLVDQVGTALKPEQQSLARELGAAWVGWTTLRPPDKFHD